jgi:hypothetical protein
MRKAMKDSIKHAIKNLQRGEGRRGDILTLNQIAHLSQRQSHQILRAILILTPVTHLISAAQVMTDEGAERNIPREASASVQEESVIIGVREGVESVIGNQSTNQKAGHKRLTVKLKVPAMAVLRMVKSSGIVMGGSLKHHLMFLWKIRQQWLL